MRDLFTDEEAKIKFYPTIGTRKASLNEQLDYLFGVELSTKISERILINGKVAVPVGGANESTVAGDIEVQWLVNEDGSLRINFFNHASRPTIYWEDQI